jgi:peroxiredoxin
MAQTHRLVGSRLPAVRLGELVNGELRSVRASEAFAAGACVIIGVPGAFTPVCSSRHLPSAVSNADRLRAAGFSQIVCVVTSDPFSIEAWSRIVDPAGKLRFLSDRNLSFTRALGLVSHEPRVFLGECSARYLLTTRDGMIDSARVEDSIFNVSCSDPEELILEGA